MCLKLDEVLLISKLSWLTLQVTIFGFHLFLPQITFILLYKDIKKKPLNIAAPLEPKIANQSSNNHNTNVTLAATTESDSTKPHFTKSSVSSLLSVFFLSLLFPFFNFVSFLFVFFANKLKI